MAKPIQLLPDPVSAYIVDWVLRRALPGVHGQYVSFILSTMDLAYANNIALLGDSFENVHQALVVVKSYDVAVSLRIKGPLYSRRNCAVETTISRKSIVSRTLYKYFGTRRH